MMGGVQPVQKPLDLRGSGRRALGILTPERLPITAIVAFAVISVTFLVLGPRLLGAATNVIFRGVLGAQLPPGMTQQQAIAAAEGKGQDTYAQLLASMNVVPGAGIDFQKLGQVLILALAVYVASFLFGWLQGRLAAGVVQRSTYRLRADVESKLTRLPLSHFDRQPRGEVLSRMTNDVDNIAQTMQQTLSQLITSVLTVVGVLAMMLWISPLLALAALITVPLSIGVTVIIAKRAQPEFVDQWAYTGTLNSHIEEMYTGHALVKVFGQQEHAIDTFRTRNGDLYQSSFRAQFVSGIIQPALAFLANLNYVVVAVVGALQVSAGTLSLGDVQAFIQYSRQFTQPITQIASMMNLLQSGVASAERVFDLLDSPEQTPDPQPTESFPEPLSGRVEFNDISFRYDSDVPLIENLSLVAEPGQTVAIVGPTGAGKTTLVNLLMRFYELDSGTIRLDGVDIASGSRDNLRSSIGMVLQDTWLFSGTIADNIGYGVDSPSHEQIVAAAEATHVDHVVRTLPEGYATVLDDEGGNISAGEQQLITIARAFLADPAILILDEATSSVDTRTEVLVQKAMSALRAGRTSFVIAHRLSTIRDADVILVMSEGAIVEKGTHDELIAAGGFYADLYTSQFDPEPIA